MNIHFETYDPRKRTLLEPARVICRWSEAHKSVLDLSLERMAEFPFSVLAFDGRKHMPNPTSADLLLGHIAVVSFEDGVATVGGYIVDPARRREGIGGALVDYLVETVPDRVDGIQMLQTFANDDSQPQFIASGGIYLGPRAEPSITGANYHIDLTPAMKAHI